MPSGRVHPGGGRSGKGTKKQEGKMQMHPKASTKEGLDPHPQHFAEGWRREVARCGRVDPGRPGRDQGCRLRWQGRREGERLVVLQAQTGIGDYIVGLQLEIHGFRIAAIFLRGRGVAFAGIPATAGGLPFSGTRVGHSARIGRLEQGGGELSLTIAIQLLEAHAGGGEEQQGDECLDTDMEDSFFHGLTLVLRKGL